MLTSGEAMDFGRGDMIDCPKCGFSQPEDRYCANCGIDMAAYKPPTPPLSRRIFSHWMFQVAAIAIVILATSAYLESRRQAAVSARMERVESARQRTGEERISEGRRASEPMPSRSAVPTASQTAASQIPPTTPPPPPPPAAPAPLAKSLARPPGEGAARPEELAAAKAADHVGASPEASGAASALARPGTSAPKSLQVIMGEFKRAFIDEAIASASESRTLNAYGTSSNGGVATIADIASRISREASGPTTSSTDALAPGQTISILKAVRDAQSKNVGFTILATPASLDENGVSLNVEVVRAMRESAAAVQERSFPDSFSIRAGAAAFMAGLLPHRPPDALERELYASTPLQILASANFQSGSSEFAIFFVPTP